LIISRTSTLLETGINIMAAILQFQNRNKAERPVLASGHTATILIYTGVRFERIDFDALKSSELEQLNNQPARLANLR
jgi:cytoplasmic iron level regulating protein YaaA (DUF328/UPF0246 family)